MNYRQAKLVETVTEMYQGAGNRVFHFLKVWSVAKTIGALEGMSDEELYVLETAAIVHDIGISSSMEKYGKYEGKIHEQEGPLVARPILEELGYEENVIERVCHLIGHHHTYNEVDGLDYQILLEADFIVNSYEKKMEMKTVRNFVQQVFKTKTGCQVIAMQNGVDVNLLAPDLTE